VGTEKRRENSRRPGDQDQELIEIRRYRAESGGTDPGSSSTTLESTTLVLAHAAPDTVVLAGLHSPLQACLAYIASPADLLGLLDLENRRTRRPDREEELRIFVQAGSLVAPIHGRCHSLLWFIAANACGCTNGRAARSAPITGPTNNTVKYLTNAQECYSVGSLTFLLVNTAFSRLYAAD
jgi:hypothetical protein